MSALTPRTLRRFIELTVRRLRGNWALIGGTVLPALGVNHRSTVDIDLIGLSAKEQSQQLPLMKLAEELGLPVETINQAGAIFLQRMGNYQKDLVVLAKSKKCTIYRPNLVLYLKLKLPRFSEADQLDCAEMFKWSAKNESESMQPRALDLIHNRLKNEAEPNRRRALEQLINGVRRLTSP